MVVAANSSLRPGLFNLAVAQECVDAVVLVELLASKRHTNSGRSALWGTSIAHIQRQEYRSCLGDPEGAVERAEGFELLLGEGARSAKTP